MSTKTFKLPSMVLLGINAIIGSGIFLLPKDAYLAFGPQSLWVILITAILVMCFALCFAEMAGKYSKTGGAYTYTMETFGAPLGFQVGWLNFFSATMTWAASAVAFTSVLSTYIPFIATPLGGNISSFFVILFSASINLLGVKESEISNNIFTLAKLIPLIIFIVIGIFFIDIHHFSITPEIAKTQGISYDFPATILLFFYVFSGFEMLPVASKAMSNPKRNIPLALLIVLTSITILYFIILLNTIGILGSAVSQSTNPIADSMQKIVGGWGFKFIWIGSLISILGIIVATGFDGPRTLSALGEDRFLPSFIAKNSKNGVPANAIIIMAFIAMIISSTGSFDILIKAESIVLLMLYLPTCVAVLVTRKRKVQGTFMIPFAPLVVGVTLISSCYLFVFTSIEEIKYGLGAIFIGLAIYFSFSRHYRKKHLS